MHSVNTAAIFENTTLNVALTYLTVRVKKSDLKNSERGKIIRLEIE